MNNNLSNILATSGVVVGFLYGIKNDKKMVEVAFYGIGLGIVGMFLGNTIKKYTE
jgi:uncharacterized membrane protein